MGEEYLIASPARRFRGGRIRGRAPGARCLGSLLFAALAVTGCADPSMSSSGVQRPASDAELRELAAAYVRRGLRYPENPAVRAQAVEACEQVLGSDAPMLIRDALSDEHPGVRFAACMALGRLKHAESLPRLREMLNDPDPSVRAGVYFALERMGDYSHRVAWRDLARRHEDPAVRRNAVMALGRLGDPKVVPLLRVAADADKDEGVRVQAMEGLALLGDRDVVAHLLRDALAGQGRQVFALLTLGRVHDDRVGPALRARLESSEYLESRLAAARSLAEQGSPAGFKLALNALNWNDPKPDLPDDPPANQVMRIQSMAAMALGQIGDRRALDALCRRMQTNEDSRVQLAAATAILMILDRTNP